MSKRTLLRALSFGCAVLLSSSSWAASLEPIEGNLSINKGKGFKSVKHRIIAHVGDAVMVGPGGSAKLVYADGCKVDVQPGAVLTVTQLSPCASGAMGATQQGSGFGWCAPPANSIDYNNPSYCAGVPVGLAVAALFGGIIYVAISP